MPVTDVLASDQLLALPIERRHLIGGERVGSAEDVEVFSPIDGSPLGTVPAGGATEVGAAVAAAREAFPAWAASGAEGRGDVLDRLADAILERADDLAAVETLDNGSLQRANRKAVVPRAARNIAHFAALARRLAEPEVIEGQVENHVRHEPAGVAALVTPWNAPLLLSTWKLGPALAAGNTVVLKPPEWAPLTCALLATLAEQAGVPPGVLNVVHGTGESAGAHLVASAGVDRVSFTGSTATGRRVGAAAAAAITPSSLELGGKSALVVFADADLDAAAATVAQQFANAGQVCLAGTRVLVDAAVAAHFRERVLAAAARATVGDPRDHDVRVGPLIHPRQLARVAGFVERALDAGARPLLGGRAHPRGGLYYEPTVLDRLPPDAEILRQEVFGPVLTWQEFGDEAECVELANGTDYGLAATLFTRDRARAERVAAALVAGTVWVNCYFVRDLDAPFGGARDSGVGREGGRWSFDFFSDVKNVAIRPDSFGDGRG